MTEMAGREATVEALESLYRADLPRFVRTATAITGNEAAGRDAVQDAFVQAVRKRDSHKGDAPLEAWVWRIVINEALALRRRRASVLESTSRTAESTNGVPERDADVRAWIATLPERQRLVFTLCQIAEQTTNEVSQTLGVSEATVRVHLFRAVRKLRGLLARER